MKTWIVIPARKGSKGYPHKNRELFDRTAYNIPAELLDSVIVTSNDDLILEKAKKFGFDVLARSEELSRDNTSVKDVLQDVIEKKPISDNDIVVVLYLTYPERTVDDVRGILKHYNVKAALSLLCKETVIQHPYLCFYEVNNHMGKRIVQHNLYRRQDYPPCFFGSHFIAIFTAAHLQNLDSNLFSEKETIFYDLDDHKIDVDYQSDLLRFNHIKEPRGD